VYGVQSSSSIWQGFQKSFQRFFQILFATPAVCEIPFSSQQSLNVHPLQLMLVAKIKKPKSFDHPFAVSLLSELSSAIMTLYVSH
jgi:uncharacterized protein (DUF697 family)